MRFIILYGEGIGNKGRTEGLLHIFRSWDVKHSPGKDGVWVFVYILYELIQRIIGITTNSNKELSGIPGNRGYLYLIEISTSTLLLLCSSYNVGALQHLPLSVCEISRPNYVPVGGTSDLIPALHTLFEQTIDWWPADYCGSWSTEKLFHLLLGPAPYKKNSWHNCLDPPHEELR